MLCEVKSKEEEHPGLTSAIGLQRAGVRASTTEWGIHGGGDGCAHRQRSQSRAGQQQNVFIFCNCCDRELLLTLVDLHFRPKLLCNRKNRSCLTQAQSVNRNKEGRSRTVPAYRLLTLRSCVQLIPVETTRPNAISDNTG